MNERDRLDDINIEEAVGRETPPDLTGRILRAAEKRDIDEAVTPVSGIHAVPHPASGRRLSTRAPKWNWQGARFVGVFVVLFTFGLVAFMLLNEHQGNVTVDPQETAENGKNESRSPQSRSPQSKSPEEENDRTHPEDTPPPDLEPNPDPVKETGPRPDPAPNPESDAPNESVHDPESSEPEIKRPDSVIEEPEADKPPKEAQHDPLPEVRPEPPKADDVVEEPEAEEDKTEARPAPAGFVVASLPIPVGRSDQHVFSRQYRVRNLDDSKWVGANEEDAAGIERDEEKGVFWIHEGARMKIGTASLALSNGAFLHADGEIRLYGHAQGMRVELDSDDLYVDNLGAPTPVRVTKGELEVVVDQGAALFESARNRLGIVCVEGEVSSGAQVIGKGQVASLTGRGLSDINEAPPGAYRHLLLRTLPQRHIGIEDFEDGPVNGMIRGQVEARDAQSLNRDEAGHVGVGRGQNATVSFQFDGDHFVMPGEVVRIRYRQKGADKLILQFWNPEKADNFGKDLPARAPGEWHVIELRMETLLDRESATVNLPEGALLTSAGLHTVGENTELEVDWIELVRDPQYGK